eukprot:6477742-Amphidinium_carterae.1
MAFVENPGLAFEREPDEEQNAEHSRWASRDRFQRDREVTLFQQNLEHTLNDSFMKWNTLCDNIVTGMFP